MSGMFDDFKEQVRSQANIVEIISEYVPLKKRGGSFWGCCPFHGEKTPSFSVTPDKNFFYCYGCHVGGDVFTFVMKMENCTFPEALKLLANKLGIAVPEKEKTKAELEREKQAKQVIAANELATRFFQACLTKTDYGIKNTCKGARAGFMRRTDFPFSRKQGYLWNITQKQIIAEQN